MLRIVGRKITLTRGDSAELSIKVSKRDGSLYELSPMVLNIIQLLHIGDFGILLGKKALLI